MRVHARCGFAEFFEPGHIVGCGFAAGFPIEEDDVAWGVPGKCQRLDGIAVKTGNRDRSGGSGAPSQRADPCKFRRYGAAGVIAFAVDTQGPFPAGCGFLDAVSDVFGDVDQGDRAGRRQAISRQRADGEPIDGAGVSGNCAICCV